MMKTTLDNEIIDCKGGGYVEKEIEQSWPIRQGAIYDKNDIEQWCDQS